MDQRVVHRALPSSSEGRGGAMARAQHEASVLSVQYRGRKPLLLIPSGELQLPRETYRALAGCSPQRRRSCSQKPKSTAGPPSRPRYQHSVPPFPPPPLRPRPPPPRPHDWRLATPLSHCLSTAAKTVDPALGPPPIAPLPYPCTSTVPVHPCRTHAPPPYLWRLFPGRVVVWVVRGGQLRHGPGGGVGGVAGARDGVGVPGGGGDGGGRGMQVCKGLGTQ